MMPFGQFNTVVISVSEIFPLDKGHYISVKESGRTSMYWRYLFQNFSAIFLDIECY